MENKKKLKFDKTDIILFSVIAFGLLFNLFAYFVLDFYPILFTLFGIKIGTFGVCIACGVLILTIVIIRLFRRIGTTEQMIDKLIIITAICGALFALGAIFFDGLWHSIEEAVTNNTKFRWEQSGVTFSGGLFTGIISFMVIYPLVLKYDRGSLFKHLDVIVIGVCIAHAFGRLGCYFGGCCYGKEVASNTFFAKLYGGTNSWILPTQLYESCFLFLLIGALAFIFKKNTCAWYFILYNTFRFILEYLRGDDRGYSPFGFLTPSQFMSIIMFIIGVVLLIFRTKIEAWLKAKEVSKDALVDGEVNE